MRKDTPQGVRKIGCKHWFCQLLPEQPRAQNLPRDHGEAPIPGTKCTASLFGFPCRHVFLDSPLQLQGLTLVTFGHFSSLIFSLTKHHCHDYGDKQEQNETDLC